MALLAMKTLLIPKDVVCCGLAKCRRLRLAGLVTLLYLLLAVPAWAAPQRSALVLSITEEGKQQDTLRTQVEELVQRAGARVITEGSLSSSARACAEPTCLGKLASEHRVELILAARISRPSRHERMVDMWIYDAKSGKEQPGTEMCDARDMKDCVTGLAGKLIGPQLTGPVPTAADGSTPKLAAGTSGSAAVRADALVTKGALPPLKPRHESHPFPRWRIGLGVGLGVLAVGAVVMAAVAPHYSDLIHIDAGPVYCPVIAAATSCPADPVKLSGLGYAAAGVLSVGAVLTFALPRTARKDSH